MTARHHSNDKIKIILAITMHIFIGNGHAIENTNCSIADFRYISLETHIGRSQIREELELGFHVPAEIVTWFFDEIEIRQRALKDLERQLVELNED